MKSYRESFGQYLISLLLIAVASEAIESGWVGVGVARLIKTVDKPKKKKGL